MLCFGNHSVRPVRKGVDDTRRERSAGGRGGVPPQALSIFATGFLGEKGGGLVSGRSLPVRALGFDIRRGQGPGARGQGSAHRGRVGAGWIFRSWGSVGPWADPCRFVNWASR